ncbi:hypothetical protein [Falsiroseomonas sp. HW251]|uniref:hypothetical protein n=1 Tax=Falsiroseomonas sp. HW251 TaxID=3390998 RepID=UPI003D3103FE
MALGLAICGLVAVGVWAGAGGPPPIRPPGAGLPPALSRSAPEPDSRAEIAAEEARLANLRLARTRLEQEVAALRDQAEQLRREVPASVAPPVTPANAPPAIAGPAPTAPPNVAASAPPALQASAEPLGRLRVFVHHRAQSAAGAGAATELAQALRNAGVQVREIRPAPFVPSTPVIRYFHEEDQAAAARLAGRLGRGWAIQDFRAYVPQPPPQTLEIWLPTS